ncbi:sulfurtransferase [Ruegeria sp. 2205SS24-7]|uniref:sulfurtransferase n=1 Tax=Ruegeria discodermiae TaxID=3064389 RepID=UPI00274108E9|nr:sulfurtransferase [Ruegeria sp. 2205SS24-7]MDP5218764.1 sulfurtransferase [Ruegeria sp. 2205SS24-7]
MNTNLTRRSFGVLSAGLAVFALPQLGFAQATQYANPDLLIEAADLIAAISPVAHSTSSPGGISLVVVDVRARDAYEAGHISGAVHLDPNAVVAPHSPIDGSLRSIQEIEAIIGNLGIDADSIVVFYDDRGGFHAARMFWLLEYLGHRNVSILNGGWTAWQAAGGINLTKATKPQTAIFQAAPSPRRHATAEDILEHRGASDAILIDVRPTHMFDEGHIPWALNVPWAHNLDEDGKFLPADALTAHFERHNIAPESNVIMHCQNGLASAHSYVALRLLGVPRVRVYHRSWAEWGSDPSLPKATS